mmetsp:Transcript_173426/g.421827  ORF Transcript_173426/g.421827 Transcript_173426/m.421827 type:complete len:269 (+) Transcript_173426:260-1066(+)
MSDLDRVLEESMREFAASQESVLERTLSASVAEAAEGKAREAGPSEETPVAHRAHFVEHVTFPVKATVEPGARIEKTWRLRNVGSESWPEGTRLVHVGNHPMSGPADGVAVQAAAPGAEVDVTVILTAPDAPGRAYSYWRLVTPDGVRFGHRVWADLVVANSNASSVIAAAEAAAAAAAAPVAPVASLAAEVSDVPAAIEEWVAVAAASDGGAAGASDEAEAEAEHQYEAGIALLAGFGFADREEAIAALTRFNGDSERAANYLMDRA